MFLLLLLFKSIGQPIGSSKNNKVGIAYDIATITAYNTIVAADGSGNFTSVQAAINAAPTALTIPYLIYIKNGRYVEKISIPANKPFIQLIGESVANTVIAYSDGASTPLSGGGTIGTFNSYTLYIAGNDCALTNLTIKNEFGDGSQAVALRVDGDRVIVSRCRIMGNQDTMLNNANAGLKQYFRNCYIDGNIDFIFGSARVILDSCVVYAKDRTTAGTSYITAANTQAGQAYGYVFRNCILPPNLGATQYYLGRPWQNATGANPFANNKTVFLNTTMGNTILPAGWSIWDAGTNTNLIYYGEYKNKKMDGSAISTASRVAWSYQLADAVAAIYTDINFFAGWNPCAAGSLFCDPVAADIAIANFRAKKTASNTVFNWNISWAMPQIKYELYRSAEKTKNYSKVSEITSQEDTTYNFQLTDVLPPIGTAYYYYVVASKQGFVSNITDTVTLSSIPEISVTSTLNKFLQNYGTASGAQTFSVSAANIPNSITLTPAAPYELSANGGVTWFANSNPLILAATNNTIASTSIAVRLNANALGLFAGNIVIASAGATTVNIPVTGACEIIPAPTSVLLQQWPLAVNNADSVAVRNLGLAASAPVFSKLFLANGTSTPGIQAYTAMFGQAFGASTNGDGTWTTAVGGPGGNLSRLHYEQFTVTANSGYKVKVDSLLFNAAFYNTSSNTKVGIMYSLTGFANDSTSVTTTPGSFATPITLANQIAGTTNTYAIALNDVNGVILNANQTLTIRLYFSCGSSSTSRYGFLKNVLIKGKATDITAPAPVIIANGNINTITQIIGTPSESQSYSLSAANLSGPLYIMAPNNFEISNDAGISWKNSTQPILLTPIGSALPIININVRLNASTLGAYKDSIQHLSTGAITLLLPLKGNTVAVPNINLTGVLTSFTHYLGKASETQLYRLAAKNLLGNLTITPPVGFEVSFTGENWASNNSPLIIAIVESNIDTVLHVRMNASVAGNYSARITHSSTGANSVSMVVTGMAINNPELSINAIVNNFVQALPVPSPAQKYSITGKFITNNVVINVPFPYEISIDNGQTWNNKIVEIVPNSGVVNAAVLARLNATALGNYVGNITHIYKGLPELAVAVKGYTTTQKEYAVCPNPAHSTIVFTHPVSTLPGKINVFNLRGLKVGTYTVAAGNYATTLPISHLSKGVYTIAYRSGNDKTFLRFLKY